MCGIVGYVGHGAAVPFLVDGLKKLEYRGYDSAGIVVQNGGSLEGRKRLGRLQELESVLSGLQTGNTGIGHTRWATHGRPSDENSHPHYDCGGRIAVVHNGIIENFLEIREWLAVNGHVFRSQTDTEVVPHLIEHYYQGDLEEAVRKALSHLRGSYALAVVSADEPGKVIGVQQDSPMIVGLGQGEFFLASDIPALLDRTRDVLILQDGEMAILSQDGVQVKDFSGQLIERTPFRVPWDAVMAEKQGYNHFMLKEIHEQPRALRDTLRGRISRDGTRVVLADVGLSPVAARAIERVMVVGCGTAYHAGLVGRFLFERLAQLDAQADLASEFRYRSPLLDEGTLLVVVSQSGETADTLAALREGRRRGAKVLAITNVVGSSAAREADYVLYTWAGPEVAVASTKAYTTQLVAVSLLAAYLAQERATMPPEDLHRFLQGLQLLPNQVEAVLACEEQTRRLAEQITKSDDAFFIGRGLDYAVAMEGQLKLKEISYIHAEAYAAGELKHGTLALIEEGVPVVALATQRHVWEKMLSNITVVQARGAYVLALAPQGLTEAAQVSDEVIYLPPVDDLLAPAVAVIPLQLLSYYVSVARGCDVDKPRNLAKSVTVE